MKFPTCLLWVNSGLFIVFGVCFIAAPAYFADALTGAAPGSSSAMIDMRATYGGTALGAGLFFGFCARRPGLVKAGLAASLFLLGGIAAARVFGFIVDRAPNPFMWLLLCAELLFVALLVLALKQIRSEASAAAPPGGEEMTNMDEQLKHYGDKLAYEIDSWDLQVALDAGERVIVIDTRSSEAYAAEHILGALPLPHRTMDAATTSGLDKNALVVTYCDGIGCNASTKGALKMTRLGFRVKELNGGLDWWKRDGHATEGSATAPATHGCGCA